MSPCLLLDPFQLHVEMLIVFFYPYVQPLQTTPLLGMKIFTWIIFFFLEWGVTNKKVGLQVIAKEMKVCS
jgi:hypothetical protein